MKPSIWSSTRESIGSFVRRGGRPGMGEPMAGTIESVMRSYGIVVVRLSSGACCEDELQDSYCSKLRLRLDSSHS